MLFFVRAYQDNLEVVGVSGRPEHCPSDPGRRRHVEAWGNGNAVLVAVDWVPHQGLVVLPEQDEHESGCRWDYSWESHHQSTKSQHSLLLRKWASHQN